MKNPAVTSAIVGIRTMDQLKEAIETINTLPLNDEEMETLKESVPVNFYEQYR